MEFLSNKISRDELERGDHIYSWRHAYLYAHHGIYVGDGQVNHFNPGDGQETRTGAFLDKIKSSLNLGKIPCPDCGGRSKRGGVISSCLNCFLAGGDLYVFKYSVSRTKFLAKPRGGTCTTAPSDPPEEVIHRASFLLQNGFQVYNFFNKNCEDFAIYCKTGLLTKVGRNGQAIAVVAATSAVLCYGGVAAYGMYCVGRLLSDIGMRRDVRKVPVETLVADMLGMDSEPEDNETR